MSTPEVSPSRWSPVLEHLKNPTQFILLAAAAYVGIFIGSRLALPALNNFIELANTAIGK